MANCVLVATMLVVTTVMQATAEVDFTRVSETSGSDVVNAVVDLMRSNCIFSGDRLILRRLAYVESRDGRDPKTYRQGYDGGIWQVDKQMFDSTLSCSRVQPFCIVISRPPFNITWSQVTWSDLRKPLFSGLAAALYLLQNYNEATFPADIQSQANIWAQSYRPGQPASDFVQLSADSTQYDCSNDMDMAFILDSSGSIINRDFQLSLNFTAGVVEEMNVPSSTRVAMLTFDSIPKVRFNFSDYSSKSLVLSAIRNTIRTTGRTDTASALDTTRTSFFATARSDARHVAVLVTDGRSNDPVLTAAAAKKLRDSGVTVFAVGVGNYDSSELHAIASEPACSHAFTLTDFSVINSIVYEIQRITCLAPKIVNDGQSKVSYTTLEPTSIVVDPTVVGPNKTVGFEVKCGTLDIYVSFTNPRPSSALYSERYTAQDGRPAYLTSSVLADGRQVFVTVIGTELPKSVAELQKCYNFSYTVAVVDKPWQITCCKDGLCRNCTDTDLLQQRDVFGQFCGVKDFGYDNPCTVQALNEGRDVFPYPYDSAMFIRCDALGNPYVTMCPPGQIFDRNSLSCGNKVSVDPQSQPATYNPCTPANLQAGLFYFPDPSNKNRFVQCDEWGNSWFVDCPAKLSWDQSALTCGDTASSENNVISPDATTQPPAPAPPSEIVNPCTVTALAAGRFYHPHPCDHQRFIQCDAFGNYFVQNCPAGLFYHPLFLVCVSKDPQPGTSC